VAVDKRIPASVLDAAISASGEIHRHYPHTETDFATDVSAMLVAAYDAWFAWTVAGIERES
jgi:hypothetical protein